MTKKKAPEGPAKPGKKAFHRHLDKAIAHNAKAELEARKKVRLTYKKLNGRTVKRHVTPYAMKNNVLVGFDHKRKATRSFRMERVVAMEKTAFWNGFEKRAETSDDETRFMLYNSANKKKKGTFRRFAGGVAAGAAAGAALNKTKRKAAAIGGAVIGGLGGLYAAHRASRENAKRERARDYLLAPEGKDKDKATKKLNPDRLLSPFGKRDLADARAAAYQAQAQQNQGGN